MYSYIFLFRGVGCSHELNLPISELFRMVLQVLADSVGIPCRLVKGQQYTGSDDAAMNFVKFDDGR